VAFAGGLIVALAIAHGTPASEPSRPWGGGGGIAADPRVAAPTGAVYGEVLNRDPDARERALREEHLRLLVAEPLLQRLPYRDPRLGITLAGVTRRGEPVLLVTYQGGIGAASRDLRALLARVRDRGGEYALRFRALP
jgi:hypothetical protein